jgi:hypothetical protein
MKNENFSAVLDLVQPVRNQVRTDPPHPLVCRRSRLNGGGLSDETGKTEAPYHSRCGTIVKNS